ncbi:uncharacterized protein Pyn_30374 [Prunus yedoensis var. nudiflora]|uniref:Uncharacterized protein n=1 Tax=Prunus yedoensis var. nudiflora TaxID=2094558 RepID=A0A314XK80_PRUYE|nr:uncharacterized protein Pyn_30374 [Prunus yedoensis var. nudiflora]
MLCVQVLYECMLNELVGKEHPYPIACASRILDRTYNDLTKIYGNGAPDGRSSCFGSNMEEMEINMMFAKEAKTSSFIHRS